MVGTRASPHRCPTPRSQATHYATPTYATTILTQGAGSRICRRCVGLRWSPSFLRSEAAIRWRESVPVEQSYEIVSRGTRAPDRFAEPLEAHWRTPGPADNFPPGQVGLFCVSAALTGAARDEHHPKYTDEAKLRSRHCPFSLSNANETAGGASEATVVSAADQKIPETAFSLAALRRRVMKRRQSLEQVSLKAA